MKETMGILLVDVTASLCAPEKGLQIPDRGHQAERKRKKKERKKEEEEVMQQTDRVGDAVFNPQRILCIF